MIQLIDEHLVINNDGSGSSLEFKISTPSIQSLSVSLKADNECIVSLTIDNETVELKTSPQDGWQLARLLQHEK